MYGFDGLSFRREPGPWHTRSSPVALLVYAVCAAVLGLGCLAVAASAGAMLAARDLLVFILALAVGAPFVVWMVAAPLAALGRYLARILGGHRVPWTVLALLVLLAVFWLATHAWVPAALDTGFGVVTVFLVGPPTVVYAALRTEQRVAQNRRRRGL